MIAVGLFLAEVMDLGRWGMGGGCVSILISCVLPVCIGGWCALPPLWLLVSGWLSVSVVWSVVLPILWSLITVVVVKAWSGVPC
jgi:hypothetical protein